MANRVSMHALRGEAARYARPKTAKERAILEAATKLFGEKGYEATRTAEIAAAAGVTERTLFRYFPSKEKLYRRVALPALLTAAVPRALTDAGRAFATEAPSFAQWHKAVLTARTAAARQAAPQYRMLVAGLMSDDAVRAKLLGIWKDAVLPPLLEAVRRYQERGELRRDVRPQAIARAIVSLNLGYIVARALLAPDANWDDAAEIGATVDLLLNGARSEAMKTL